MTLHTNQHTLRLIVAANKEYRSSTPQNYTSNFILALQPLLKNHVFNCPKIWETDYGGKNSW